MWTFFRLGPDDNIGAVMRAARNFCALPWARVVAGPWGQQFNVEKYCLWAPYAVELLTTGLGLVAEQVNIGGWASGVAEQVDFGVCVCVGGGMAEQVNIGGWACGMAE